MGAMEVQCFAYSFRQPRRAPGYLVRFIAAIFDAGLEKSLVGAQQQVGESKERYRARPYHWDDSRDKHSERGWSQFQERAVQDAYRDRFAAGAQRRPEMPRAATFADKNYEAAPHPAYLATPAPANPAAAGAANMALTTPAGWQNTMPASMAYQGPAAEAQKNTVVPLAAEMGKTSIDGLAACLDTRDLTYWQDILGFDLATPAV